MIRNQKIVQMIYNYTTILKADAKLFVLKIERIEEVQPFEGLSYKYIIHSLIYYFVNILCATVFGYPKNL